VPNVPKLVLLPGMDDGGALDPNAPAPVGAGGKPPPIMFGELPNAKPGAADGVAAADNDDEAKDEAPNASGVGC